MNKRIEYIDGLKGAAALSVVLSHIYIISYYSSFVLFGASAFGNDAAMDQVIINSPVSGVLSNDCLGFALFFTMIAIFPVMKFRKTGSVAMLANSAIKRYFQLLGPCLPVAIIAVLLYYNGIYSIDELAAKTGCNWLLVALTPAGCDTLGNFLYTVFYGIWAGYPQAPVTVMWCMYIILTGSWALYAAYALLGSSHNRYLPGLALLVLSIRFPHMSFFAAGSLMTEFVFLSRENRRCTSIGTVMLLAGLILGFILCKIPANFYPVSISSYYLDSLGSALIIWSLHDLDCLHRFFSARWLTFLGSISFEIILIHAIFLATIGCKFYSWLLDYTTAPELLLAADFIIVLLPTIPASMLLNRYVSQPLNRFLKRDFLGAE